MIISNYRYFILFDYIFIFIFLMENVHSRNINSFENSIINSFGSDEIK